MFLHDSIHDRFDASEKQPGLTIGPNEKFAIKFKKTRIQSINTDKSMCINDDTYGYERCRFLMVKHNRS